MSERELITHQEKVKSVFHTLPRKQALTFGAFCVERQWAVYVRAANDKKWGKQKLLRSALDAIWGWLLGKEPQPDNYHILCEGAILDDIEDDNATFSRYVAVSFYCLSYAVEKDEPSEALGAIQNNLNIIDFLVSDFLLQAPLSVEGYALVDAHELVQNEIAQQNAALEILLQREFTAVMVESLQELATGRSIFGDYWFE